MATVNIVETMTEPPNPATIADVDPSNVEQLRAWDGETGRYWAEHADRFDQGVARYQEKFLVVAEIEPGATVLDIGCGNGRSSRDAARLATDGTVLGVDLSARMLAHARLLAEREQLANVTFRQADAQTHPFPPRSFDVAISRNGAMFFGDPRAAFANIAGALRPGGRLALQTWQPIERNAWMSSFATALAAGRELPQPPPGAPGPLSLSDPDRVRELLTSAGFADVGLLGVAEPMYFGADPDDACRYIAGQSAGMLEDLDSGAREGALRALRAIMAAHHTERGVLFDSAAWLVTARRT